MDKPNRAERRKSKFGGGRATEHGGWPMHQENPVFHEPETTDDSAGPAKSSAPAKSAGPKPAAPAKKPATPSKAGPRSDGAKTDKPEASAG